MNRTTLKVLSIVCALIIGTGVLQAQDLKQNRRKAQTIRDAGDRYYYGEASGKDEREARSIAMEDLLSKISSSVMSDFQLDMSNVVNGQDATSESVMNGVIRTYTSGSVNNIKELILERSPQVRVMRYITKSSMDSIFNLRKDRVIQFIRDALVAEQKKNIDDALRLYSYGLGLLKSVQNPSSVKCAVNGIMDSEKTLIDWIPQQIREILRNLKTEVAEIDGQEVKLMVTYKGAPVSSVDFTYNNGTRNRMTSVKDGMSLIRLEQGMDVADVEIQYEYAYKNEMQDYPELEMMAQIYKAPSFKDAKAYILKGNKKEMKAVQKQFETAAQEEATPHDNFLKRNQAKDYTGSVMKIAEAIKQKKYDSVKDLFTEEGYRMYERLLKYGDAKILKIPELHCFPYRDKIICRSIPMRFIYPANRREFVEDVTFTFNNEDLIESLAFGLDKATREDIYTDGHLTSWGDSTCTMIATFLENYKTAFALHRLDYIQSIFADEARIITGSVLKPASAQNRNNDLSKGVVQLKNHPLVKYTEQNKQEYIKSLEECFRRNEFINIRFTDCIVDQMDDRERFGINIRQDYYSNTYSDTGFLFLLINASDPENPMIQYRTWQPERDPSKFNNKPRKHETPEEYRLWGIITSGNFQ